MLTINTASDSQFFFKLLSLISSIKKNDLIERKIRVWDIGLTLEQINLLENIKNVEVVEIPNFMENYRACYAWKIYIYKHIPEDLVLYMDTGMSILKNIAKIEEIIIKNDYFTIGQGAILNESTPVEYWDELNVDKKYYNDEQLAAGLFGFKRTDKMNNMIDEAYEWTKKGYTLGYSQSDISWRDKYNLGIVRDCKIFRQDQTLLNLIFRKHIGTPIFSDIDLFGNPNFLNDNKQIICYHRSIFKKNIIYIFFSKHTNMRFKSIFLKMIIFKILNQFKRKVLKFV